MSLLYSILSNKNYWHFDSDNNQMIFHCPNEYQDWYKSTFTFLNLLHLKPYVFHNKLTLSVFDYHHFIRQSERLNHLRLQPVELRYLFQLNLWQVHSNQTTVTFHLSDIPDISLDIIKNYFDDHHIPFTLKNKMIHISKYDFIRLHKSLNGFKPLSPALQQSTGLSCESMKITHLTQKEWYSYFKRIKLFGRLFSDTTYFRFALFKSALDHPINVFLLRNNQALTNQSTCPTHIYVDSSTDTNKRLDEIDALGLYAWPGDFINLHTKILHNRDFIPTLLHEINHRVQFFNGLEYNSLAVNQVMEASSTAIGIINDIEAPYDKIFDDCFDFVEKNLNEEIYASYLTETKWPEQRLFSLDYLIRAEAELKMHQCMTEMYLAKDRAMLYDVMVKHHISLDSQDFNDLCDDIDHWKKYNLNHYITLSVEEMQPSQNKHIFENIFHLTINTSPTALFTNNELNQLGFEHIKTVPAPTLTYQYKGATCELLREAEKDYNLANINALNKKFRFLQKLNPVLNNIIVNKGDYLMAQNIFDAISSMVNHKPISTILSHLNYNMTDNTTIIDSQKSKQIQIRNNRQR